MAGETIALQLVTPERLLKVAVADMVVLPGVEGDFGAMPQHAPVISALRPGIIAVHGGGAGAEEYVVTGGFVEVTGEKVVVLAEEAVPRAEYSRERLEERIAALERQGDVESVPALRELVRQLS